jgi:hypothetical protein
MNKHYAMGCIPKSSSQPASIVIKQRRTPSPLRAKTDSELSIQLSILQHGVSVAPPV